VQEPTSKRVLISGIAGAIGVHMFAHIMHNTDWHVVGIDSFRHKGYVSRIAQVMRDHPEWRDRWEIWTHDLTAPVDLPLLRQIGDIDYMINLASMSDVSDSIDNPRPFVENNVALMLTMLELARDLEPEAFLHFSTDEVYGPADRDQGHAEWATILPSNPYSASKAAQEALAISYWRSFDVPVIITNTMNNFGEMQAPSKFPAMIQQRIVNEEVVDIHTAGDGEIGTRYYLHSRNAADAILFILNETVATLHVPGHIDRPARYNVVGDAQLDNLELAQAIAGLMGATLHYRKVDFHSDQPGHDLHYGLDGTKLKELGWESPISFRESLANTIQWTEEHPEWH